MLQSAPAQQTYEPVGPVGTIARQPWLPYTTIDTLGRSIRFYLSETGSDDRVLPLVVYVHGSGGNSHFQRRGERIVGSNGHSTVNDVFRQTARILIVEKPGVDYLMTPGDSGLSSSDYQEFRHEHTLERWCEAIHAAIVAALSLPGVKDSGVLVIGHSEGGLVAAKLAADYPMISHVAVLAGGGPSQLYDLLVLANRGTFFAHVSDVSSEREGYVMDRWQEILRNSENSEQLFFGHPYRRWATFLQTSTIEQLSNTEASIFIAQGEADPVVAVETATMAYAHLLSIGKDADLLIVEGGDHNFVYTKDTGERVDGWSEIHAAVRDWYTAKGGR